MAKLLISILFLVYAIPLTICSEILRSTALISIFLTLASVWFVGFSSYLLFVGIYFTALSVARDAELRRIIRKSVERQSGLLDSIGISEGEYQIRKNVLSVTKNITIEQGLKSSSIDEKDIKEYIDMVITELKKKSK